MANQERQNGSVLLISLMLLIVVTMLAFTVSESVLQQEKMSNSSKESTLALQAAELALKDGQIAVASMSAATFTSGFSLQGDLTGIKGFYDGSTCNYNDANCYLNTLRDPYAKATWKNAITTLAGVSCGTADVSCVLKGQYLIIKISKIDVAVGPQQQVVVADSSGAGGVIVVAADTYLYKVLARGEGNNGEQVKVLSSYYIQSVP